ncbi:MAG: DMT family transporter [Tuberibacillus sp.]
MKGLIIALLAGGFITLQGVVNTQMSNDIGTWQTATITQLTSFTTMFIVVLLLRDKNWKHLRHVKPLYLSGGLFGSFIITSNVTAFQYIGATLTISPMLIAQLGLTFVIDSLGWFGFPKQKIRLPQMIGIGLMITGVCILGF